MNNFEFKIRHKDKQTKARAGEIQTPHGVIKTPAFVPVGTQASVKSLTPGELEELGVNLFFVNTYHTYLRPGMDVIKKLGGLHKFMGCKRPIITDSGGFQAFSLARAHSEQGQEGSRGGSEDVVVPYAKISEDGVEFRSHWDGTKHIFNPENSMEYQWMLGSDIHIAFDHCTPYPVTHEKAKASMERTHRWATRSLTAHQALSLRGTSQRATRQSLKFHDISLPVYQALYGVVQGSVFEDLRKVSAKTIGSMDFDGIAIGGVAVGESKKEMKAVLDWVCPLLPDEKPRHLLGVGEIDDIFELVAHGVDTFDCVQPTRLARMGRLFCRNKRINEYTNNPMNNFSIDITKREFESDPGSLDEGCTCYTCQHFSRAYIHHLFRVRELLGYRLATIHNLHFVLSLTADIRNAIENGTFLDLRKKWLYD